MRFLFLLAAAFALSAADDPGFVSLFNGKNLRGWVEAGRQGRGYIVEDGLLVCPADGGGNLLTAKEYADFILRLEFKVEEGGNNGVGIRTPLEGDAAYVGMEIQILDDYAPKYAKLRPAQYTGSIYDVFGAKRNAEKPAGQWNDYEITAKGRKIKVVLNGQTIIDADLDTVKDPEVLKKHPGLARTTGHLGFLGHGSRVEFRNIRLKVLD